MFHSVTLVHTEYVIVMPDDHNSLYKKDFKCPGILINKYANNNLLIKRVSFFKVKAICM